MKEHLKLLAIVVIRGLLKIFWVFPIQRRQILFFPIQKKQNSSAGNKGTSFCCNPKYIYTCMQDKYQTKFDYIWVLSEQSPVIPGAKTVRFKTFSYIKAILTSQVIITNNGVPLYLPFRKNQLLINTWHGGGAYKKCHYKYQSDFGKHMERWVWGRYDIFLSTTKKFSKCFKQTYRIKSSTFWNIGMPRNDLLMHRKQEDRKRILKSLNLNSDNKLLLYAPTYRGNISNAEDINITFDPEACKNALSKRFGGDWIVGFRMHYAYNAAVENIPGSLNLSAYPDMQELLLAADVLITDYSSSIWDFSLTGKPCFIYADDLDKYKREVDFYTPIEEWPFPLAQTNAELAENILTFDEVSYQKAIEKHHQELGICETGRASELVADAIYDYCFRGTGKEEILKRR